MIPAKLQQGSLGAQYVLYETPKNEEEEPKEEDGLTKEKEFSAFYHAFKIKSLFLAGIILTLSFGVAVLASDRNKNSWLLGHIILHFGAFHAVIEMAPFLEDEKEGKDEDSSIDSNKNGAFKGFLRFIHGDMKRIVAAPCNVPGLFLLVSAATIVVQISILIGMSDFFGIVCYAGLDLR